MSGIIGHYGPMCRKQRQQFPWRRQHAQNINGHHKVKSNNKNMCTIIGATYGGGGGMCTIIIIMTIIIKTN